MTYPVSIGPDGVKIQPKNMEKEKLYHCLFKDKVLLIFKDDEDFLNCYEIEEQDLVEKVIANGNQDEVEKILDEYIDQKNLKH